MHPTPSIIVFTVLSGIGLGMMAWIGLGFVEGHAAGWLASGLALLFTAVGGAASVFHLMRPDRAWRAFSQWRSSWLSREACLVPVTTAVFAAVFLRDLERVTRGVVAGGALVVLGVALVTLGPGALGV